MNQPDQIRAEMASHLPTSRRGQGFVDSMEVADDGRTLRGRIVPYGKWIKVAPSLVERYEPGVFRESTADPSSVKICLEHGQVIGRATGFEERADGLHFTSRISGSDDIPEARKARAMLTDGLADELSVGFMSLPGGTDVEGSTPELSRWRHRRARLMEVSLVPWGAMGREATVTRAEFWDEEAEIAKAVFSLAQERERDYLARLKRR